jgi:hypothetical protein
VRDRFHELKPSALKFPCIGDTLLTLHCDEDHPTAPVVTGDCPLLSGSKFWPR